MGLAELFGGVAKSKYEEVSQTLEETRAKLSEVEQALAAEKQKKGKAKAPVEDNTQALAEARQAKKKADKKAQQAAQARSAAEDRVARQEKEIERLGVEIDTLRRAMLSAKDEAEEAIAGRLEAERKLATAAPAPKAEAPVKVVEKVERPEPAPRRSNDDLKLQRVQEKLDAVSSERDALKGRVDQAEKDARGAEKRRLGDLHKAEAAVRDMEHHLRAERKAYKILQQQFEALVDQDKGREQAYAHKLAKLSEGAAEPAAEAKAPESAPAKASAPKPLAEVLPDAPPVVPEAPATIPEPVTPAEAPAEAPAEPKKPLVDPVLAAGGKPDAEG